MGKTINQLSTASSLSGGDQLVTYSSNNGDARKTSLTSLVEYFETAFANPTFEVQTSAPTSTGFTFTLTSSSSSIWAILSPTGAFAAGTVALPAASSSSDGQEVLITTTQAIDVITVTSSGATIVGVHPSMGAGASMRLRYRSSSTTWYVADIGIGTTPRLTNMAVLNAIVDTIGNEFIKFTQPGFIAANEFTVANGQSGAGPAISTTGTDTDIDFNINPKGAGQLFVSNVAVTTRTGTQTLTNKTLTAPKITVTTVAGLTAAATAGSGARAHVSDATVTTFASNVVGGGANNVPVYSDGTNWKIG